jgi:ubiquinol-cytochrome c reductase cytochrome c1 subunit
MDGRAGAEDAQAAGVWVLLFLGIFSVLAWRLNASYWKNVK